MESYFQFLLELRRQARGDRNSAHGEFWARKVREAPALADHSGWAARGIDSSDYPQATREFVLDAFREVWFVEESTTGFLATLDTVPDLDQWVDEELLRTLVTNLVTNVRGTIGQAGGANGAAAHRIVSWACGRMSPQARLELLDAWIAPDRPVPPAWGVLSSAFPRDEVGEVLGRASGRSVPALGGDGRSVWVRHSRSEYERDIEAMNADPEQFFRAALAELPPQLAVLDVSRHELLVRCAGLLVDDLAAGEHSDLLTSALELLELAYQQSREDSAPWLFRGFKGFARLNILLASSFKEFERLAADTGHSHQAAALYSDWRSAFIRRAQAQTEKEAALLFVDQPLPELPQNCALQIRERGGTISYQSSEKLISDLQNFFVFPQLPGARRSAVDPAQEFVTYLGEVIPNLPVGSSCPEPNKRYDSWPGRSDEGLSGITITRKADGAFAFSIDKSHLLERFAAFTGTHVSYDKPCVVEYLVLPPSDISADSLNTNILQEDGALGALSIQVPSAGIAQHARAALEVAVQDADVRRALHRSVLGAAIDNPHDEDNVEVIVRRVGESTRMRAPHWAVRVDLADETRQHELVTRLMTLSRRADTSAGTPRSFAQFVFRNDLAKAFANKAEEQEAAGPDASGAAPRNSPSAHGAIGQLRKGPLR
ncbi:MAG: hypothetical protein HOQ05_06260 [Corynebacteriales bacterium]|nr:hypothetical protein [Mycobacteriales bacterium]